MPWTQKDYPDSMKNLPKEVRNKAIDIANALIEERSMDEGILIATAISRAKDWAANRGKKFETVKGTSRKTDVKEHGKDRYVIPSEDGWAIKEEGEDSIEKSYRTKKEAVSHARKEAREDNVSLTIQRRDGKVEKRISYNPRNKGFQRD